MGLDYSYTQPSDSEDLFGNNDDYDYSETEDLIRRRLYYTCANVDDGECHVWKWWDEAVMEEMRARDRHVLQLAEKVENLTLLSDYETEQKLRSIEKIVGAIVKEKSDHKYGFECFVIGMVLVVVVLAMVVMFV
ncbi:hypothetical protein Bca4012_036312 [Brassica carinata]